MPGSVVSSGRPHGAGAGAGAHHDVRVGVLVHFLIVQRVFGLCGEPARLLRRRNGAQTDSNRAERTPGAEQHDPDLVLRVLDELDRWAGARVSE